MKLTGAVPAHEVQCIAMGHSYTATAADDESDQHRVRGGFSTLHSKRGEFAILVSQLNGKAYAVGEGSHGQLGIQPESHQQQGSSTLLSRGSGAASGTIVPPRPAHTDSSGAILGTHTFRLPSPQPIPFFFQNRLTITKVSCGQHHSAFLSNTGRLFTCGLATYGRLGLGPVASSGARGPPSHAQAMKDVVWTPQEVHIPCMDSGGASVQAGFWAKQEQELSLRHQRSHAIRAAHVAARAAREDSVDTNQSNRVDETLDLTPGDARPASASSATGLAESAVDVSGFTAQRHPEVAQGAPPGTRVVMRERPSVWLDVECGDRYTVGISGPLDGVVDRTTESVTEPVALSFQDLGQGDPQEEEKHPVRDWGWEQHAGTPLRPPLVRVWAAGDSTDGRLGAGLSGDAHTPIALPYFSRSAQITHGVPVSISVGRSHTLLLTHTGRTFSWGMGRYGQLGHGCREDEYSPRHVTHSGFARLVIRHVSAGTRHSLALDSHRRLWVWGHSGNGRLGLPPTGWQYTPPDGPAGTRSNNKGSTAQSGGSRAETGRGTSRSQRPPSSAHRDASDDGGADSDDFDEEMYGRYGIKQRSDPLAKEAQSQSVRRRRQEATGEALYSALTGGRSNAAGYRASLSMRDEEEAYETTGRSGMRRRRVVRLNGMAMLPQDWDTTQDVLFPVQWQAMPEHPLGEPGVLVESIHAGHAGSAVVDSLGRLFVAGHNALCEMGTRDTLDRYVFTHVRTFDTEAYATGNRQFNETVGGSGAGSPAKGGAGDPSGGALQGTATKPRRRKKGKSAKKSRKDSALKRNASFASGGTGVADSMSTTAPPPQTMQRKGSRNSAGGSGGMLKRPPSWGGLSFASATSGSTGRVQLGGVAAVLAQNRASGAPTADIARAAAAAAQGIAVQPVVPRPPQQAAKKWSLSTRAKRSLGKGSARESKHSAQGMRSIDADAAGGGAAPASGAYGEGGGRGEKPALVPRVKLALCGPSFTLVVIIVQQRADSAAARAAALAAAEHEAETARAVLERRFLGSGGGGSSDDSGSSSHESGSGSDSDSDESLDLAAPYKGVHGGGASEQAARGSAGYDDPLAGTTSSVLSAAETALDQLAAADSAVRRKQGGGGSAMLPGVRSPPPFRPHVPPLQLNLTAPPPQVSDDEEDTATQNTDRQRASVRVFRPLHAALADQAAREAQGETASGDFPLYQLGGGSSSRQVQPPPAASTALGEGDAVPSKTEYYRWLLAKETPEVPSVEHPSVIRARKQRLKRMRRQLDKQHGITAALLESEGAAGDNSRAAAVDAVLSRGGVSEHRAAAPVATSVSNHLASGGALRSVSQSKRTEDSQPPSDGESEESSSSGNESDDETARSQALARLQAGSYDPLQSTENTSLETILAQRRQRFLKREEVVTQLDLRRMYDGRLYKDQQEAIMVAMLNRFDRNTARDGQGGEKSSTQPIVPGGPSLQQVMVEAMRGTGGAPSSVRGRMARSYARQAIESTAEVQDWKIDPRGVADTVNRQRQLEQWATNKWQRPDAHQGMDLARTKWAKIIKSRGGYSWRPPEDPTDVALDMHPVLGNWAPKAGKVAPAASARSNRRTAPHSTGGTASARGAEGGSEPKRRSMSQRLSALRRSREVAGDSATQTFDLGLDAEFEEEGVVLDKKGFVVLRGGEFIVDGVHLPEAAVPEELKHQPHLLRRYAQSVAFARSDVAAGDSRGSSSPSRSMRTPGHVVTAALAGFGYNSSGGSDIRLGADTGSMAQLSALSSSVSPRDMLQRRQWSTRKHARSVGGAADESTAGDAGGGGQHWPAASGSPPGSPSSANRHDAAMLQRAAAAYGGYDSLEDLVEDASAGLLGSSLLPGNIPTASAAASAGAVAAAGLGGGGRQRARNRMGDAETAAMRLVDQRLEASGQLSPASSDGGGAGGGDTPITPRGKVKRSASKRLSSYSTAVHKLPADELSKLVVTATQDRVDTAAPLAPPSPVQTRFHGTPAFKATAAVSPAARRVPPSVVMSLHRYAMPAGTVERRTGAHAAAASRMLGGGELPSTAVPLRGEAYDMHAARADDASHALAFDWQGPRAVDENDVHLPEHLQAEPDAVRDYGTLKEQHTKQRRGMAPSGSASSLISEATGPTSSLTYLSSSDKATHAAEQAMLLVRAAKQESPYFKRLGQNEEKES